jgi:hypothetical protein
MDPSIATPKKGLVNVKYEYLNKRGHSACLPLPEQIGRLKITDFVRKFTSNFPDGSKTAEGFYTKKEIKAQARGKNTRGRKPKAPTVRLTDFSSQMTFYVIHEGEQIQIKVFVKNSIHIPDMPTDDYSIADQVASRLVAYFNECFQDLPFYEPIRPGEHEIMLSNYSGFIILPPNHVLDLLELGKLLDSEEWEWPLEKLLYAYNYGDTKAKVFFANPSPTKPEKMATIPVQLSGKISVMGDNNKARIMTLYYAFANFICKYRERLVKRCY